MEGESEQGLTECPGAPQLLVWKVPAREQESVTNNQEQNVVGTRGRSFS